MPEQRAEPISRSVAKSPKLLKSVLCNRKVFIRPLQKDLDISAVDEGPSADDSVVFSKFEIICSADNFIGKMYLLLQKSLS